MADSDHYLTVKETAERLRLSTKTIHRWIASGRLKAQWLGSDRAGWRIKVSDLDDALQRIGRADVPQQQRLLTAERRAAKKLAA